VISLMNINLFKRYFLVLLVPVLLAVAACEAEESDSGAQSDSDSQLSVLTTIYPMTYFSQRVGGDRVTVESLFRVGIDAHDFEPTPGDIISISNADLLVYNHPAFESWVEGAIAAATNDSLIVVKAADVADDAELTHDHGHEDEHADEATELVEAVGHVIEEVEHGDITADAGVGEIDAIVHSFEGEHYAHDHEDEEHEEHLDELIEELESVILQVESGALSADVGIEEIEVILGAHDHDDHEEGSDPHFWLNPLEAVKQVQAIETAFGIADPEGADLYAENAITLISELLALDTEIADGLGSCELDHVVVSHKAYGHLAERYGIEQIGLQGLSTEGDANPKRVAEIIDVMKALGVTHVLQEPIAGSPLAETVASETGSAILPLHPMESLTASELENGDSYFSIMRTNLDSLRTALRCS
jgi:zinc transport system substrate-binding protein